MANEGTDMTDLTQKEQCKRGCMRWGAGVGLVLALLFWLVFGWGFIASLFLGIILGLVTFVVLSKFMCGSLGDEPMQTASTPAAAAAPATAATTQVASAAPTSDAEVEPEPTLEAEPAATETVETRPEDTTGGQAKADVGGAASEATAGTSPAAKDEPAAFSGIKPTAKLKGQEELAARKGSYKYEAPAAEPAQAKAAPAPAPATEAAAEPVASIPEPTPAETPQAPATVKGATSTRSGIADIPAGTVESSPETLDKPRAGGADNLKLISGVGPKLEQTLNELGIYHFDQIAKWTAAEIAWVDARVRFKGRIQRDDWMAQAKTLASGGETEFSTRSKKT
jgi:predicted flap endonuclease-1-like 5' DNA nuclease